MKHVQPLPPEHCAYCNNPGINYWEIVDIDPHLDPHIESLCDGCASQVNRTAHARAVRVDLAVEADRAFEITPWVVGMRTHSCRYASYMMIIHARQLTREEYLAAHADAIAYADARTMRHDFLTTNLSGVPGLDSPAPTSKEKALT